MPPIEFTPSSTSSSSTQVYPLPGHPHAIGEKSQFENQDEDFCVKLDLDDPNHPKNWPRWYKWYITVFGGILALNSTFASSAPSGAIGPLIEEFNLSDEVATLTISLFVAGYCFGPLLWGPLSETYGRKHCILWPFCFYTLFQIGNALAPNTAALLIFRFLGGFFASAPLTNAPGLLADIWDPVTRGKAVSLFGASPFAGPSVAPLVSGFMIVSGVSWHWVFWMLAIFSGTCTLLIAFTLRESYEPRLLVLMAQKKRKETGDERWYAPIEKRNIPFSQRLQDILAKPFMILALEPMLQAVTLYMSFIFGCLYLLFDAYPIVFTQGHGLNAGLTGLTYLPIAIGGILGVIVYIIYWSPRYERLVAQYSPEPVPPEYRLEMAVWATIPYAAAFFWFGWTSYPEISLWAPLSQGVIMGWGIMWLFMAQLNYIIDTYRVVAASALAANTVTRSIFGATFPLFASQMYRALNPRIASTVLGALACLCIPIPFVLKRYGHILRSKSRYAHKVAVAAKPKVDDSSA